MNLLDTDNCYVGAGQSSDEEEKITETLLGTSV